MFLSRCSVSNRSTKCIFGLFVQPLELLRFPSSVVRLLACLPSYFCLKKYMTRSHAPCHPSHSHLHPCLSLCLSHSLRGPRNMGEMYTVIFMRVCIENMSKEKRLKLKEKRKGREIKRGKYVAEGYLNSFEKFI